MTGRYRPETYVAVARFFERAEQIVSTTGSDGRDDFRVARHLAACRALGKSADMSSIAAITNRTRKGALNLVLRLEQNGLIARHADPRDKRRTIVEATELGRATWLPVVDRIITELITLFPILERERNSVSE